jgi:hypothetical protein
MKNNTEEKTAYQLLLEKLDDKDFARQFTEEKQKEIEELLAQILMVTTGASVVQGTCEEWGHENLFKIFDILMIRHKNFFIPDVMENLKFYLFTWTKKHSEAYREWSGALESDQSTDETQETSEVQNTPGEFQELENLAVQISKVMKNPLIPTRLYNAMSDELTAVIADSDSPEWILGNLKKQSGKE